MYVCTHPYHTHTYIHTYIPAATWTPLACIAVVKLEIKLGLLSADVIFDTSALAAATYIRMYMYVCICMDIRFFVYMRNRGYWVRTKPRAHQHKLRPPIYVCVCMYVCMYGYWFLCIHEIVVTECGCDFWHISISCGHLHTYVYRCSLYTKEVSNKAGGCWAQISDRIHTYIPTCMHACMHAYTYIHTH